ncbi:hypothetical protein PENSPDRAFT_109639 [Peniophora sp. CONT]|nr:hypothetical protein PENSPDRAFT_109639 [Peniophora sp. CONT]
MLYGSGSNVERSRRWYGAQPSPGFPPSCGTRAGAWVDSWPSERRMESRRATRLCAVWFYMCGSDYNWRHRATSKWPTRFRAFLGLLLSSAFGRVFHASAPTEINAICDSGVLRLYMVSRNNRLLTALGIQFEVDQSLYTNPSARSRALLSLL